MTSDRKRTNNPSYSGRGKKPAQRKAARKLSSEDEDTISGDESEEELGKLVREELQTGEEAKRTRIREETGRDHPDEPAAKKKKEGSRGSSPRKKKTEGKGRDKLHKKKVRIL